MMEDNDKMINDFFQSMSNMEIPDNGFSNGVMKEIGTLEDKRIAKLSRIWTCACSLVGVAFVIFCGVLNGTHISVTNYAQRLTHILCSDIFVFFHDIANINVMDIPPFVLLMPTVITLILAVVLLKNDNKIIRYV